MPKLTHTRATFSDSDLSKGRFIVMPYEVMQDIRITPLEFRIYVAALSFSNPKGKPVFASCRTIGNVIKTDHKRVAAALRKFQELGYVVLDRGPKPNSPAVIHFTHRDLFQRAKDAAMSGDLSALELGDVVAKNAQNDEELGENDVGYQAEISGDSRVENCVQTGESIDSPYINEKLTVNKEITSVISYCAEPETDSTPAQKNTHTHGVGNDCPKPSNDTHKISELSEAMIGLHKTVTSLADQLRDLTLEFRKEKHRRDKAEAKAEPSTTETNVQKSDSPAVVTFECSGSVKSFNVTQADIDEWADVFLGVDVLLTIKRAKAWIDANPARRKTAKGMKRFLVNWLGKDQDRGVYSRMNERFPKGHRTNNPALARDLGHGTESLTQWAKDLVGPDRTEIDVEF